jgi:hypothetical protein
MSDLRAEERVDYFRSKMLERSTYLQGRPQEHLLLLQQLQLRPQGPQLSLRCGVQQMRTR